MFDNRVLSDNLYVIHLEEALSDLVPRGYCADVVEHRRGLCEADSLLYLLDELDAPEVHVVVVLPQT